MTLGAEGLPELLDYRASTRDTCEDRTLDLLGDEITRTAAQVARETRCSSTTARKALSALEATGLVKATRQRVMSGRQPAATYSVTRAGQEAVILRERALEQARAQEFLEEDPFAGGAFDPSSPVSFSVQGQGDQTRVEASQDGVPVGHLTMQTLPDDPRPWPGHGQEYAEVLGVRVHPEARGHGIATQLYEHAAEEAAYQGLPLASADDRTWRDSRFWAKQQRKRRARKERVDGASRYFLTHPPPERLNPLKSYEVLHGAQVVGLSAAPNARDATREVAGRLGLPVRALRARPLNDTSDVARSQSFLFGEDPTQAFLRGERERKTGQGELFNPPPGGCMTRRRPPRRRNADKDLRALERAAAMGDPQAKTRLAAAQRRLSDPFAAIPGERAFMRTLAEQAGLYANRGWVERKHYATAIRATLKAAGIKGASVTSPNYSMASSVEIRPRRGDRFSAAESRAIAHLFGQRYRETDIDGRPWEEQSFSLYPSHEQDQSDSHTDYFHPGGPTLERRYWNVFLDALVKAVHGGSRKRKTKAAPPAPAPPVAIGSAWVASLQEGHRLRFEDYGGPKYRGTWEVWVVTPTPKGIVYTLAKIGKGGPFKTNRNSQLVIGQDALRQLAESGNLVVTRQDGPRATPESLQARPVYLEPRTDHVVVHVSLEDPRRFAIQEAVRSLKKRSKNTRGTILVFGADPMELSVALLQHGLHTATGDDPTALYFNPRAKRRRSNPMLALVGNPGARANPTGALPVGLSGPSWTSAKLLREIPLSARTRAAVRRAAKPRQPLAWWWYDLPDPARIEIEGAYDAMPITNPRRSPARGRAKAAPSRARAKAKPTPRAKAKTQTVTVQTSKTTKTTRSNPRRRSSLTPEDVRALPGYDVALERFKQFHGGSKRAAIEPEQALVVRVPDGSRRVTRKVVVAVGRVPETHYLGGSAPKGSTKKGYHWVHEHEPGREPIEVLDPETRGVHLKLPLDKRTRTTDWMRG